MGDWLTGSLGAGLGAISSVVGGLMNTSSAQSINAANIANAQAMASGAFLPALVQNAEKAGISPLAALGYRVPPTGNLMPTDPGSGLANAGRFLSQLKTPHELDMERLAVQLGQANVEKVQTESSNMKMDMATRAYLIDFLREHPDFHPSGAVAPSSAELASSWLNSTLSQVTQMGQGINQAARGLFSTNAWTSPYTQSVGETLGR